MTNKLAQPLTSSWHCYIRCETTRELTLSVCLHEYTVPPACPLRKSWAQRRGQTQAFIPVAAPFRRPPQPSLQTRSQALLHKWYRLVFHLNFVAFLNLVFEESQIVLISAPMSTSPKSYTPALPRSKAYMQTPIAMGAAFKKAFIGISNPQSKG